MELQASMRPQHITAENISLFGAGGFYPESFNEAAAYHCGKHVGPCCRLRNTAPLQ